MVMSMVSTLCTSSLLRINVIAFCPYRYGACADALMGLIVRRHVLSSAAAPSLLSPASGGDLIGGLLSILFWLRLGRAEFLVLPIDFSPTTWRRTLRRSVLERGCYRRTAPASPVWLSDYFWQF